MQSNVQRQRRRLLLLLLLLGATVATALLTGRYPSPGVISPSLLAEDPLARTLVLNLRLPRVIAALLLGSGLASAGFVFQMLFANPLVEPGFLGVSQGAAFGAAFVIVFFGATSLLVQLSATIFALIALFLSYYIARKFRFGGWILRLVL